MKNAKNSSPNKSKRRSSWLFVFLLFALFVLCDLVLTATAPVSGSDLFLSNDYEITLQNNGGKTEYDKVFFGNSVVISSYIESESTSGYANFGIDYGKVDDLLQMLQKGMLTVNEELVLGLNYFTLMDTLDTNPSYPWHRQMFEPYLYFERDRLHSLLTDTAGKLLHGESSGPAHYTDLQKAVYHGMMNEEQLAEKIATHRELFWDLPMDNYEKNLAALDKLCKYCAENEIRLRVVWMPWNDFIEMPEKPKQVRALADEILNANAVEIHDMESSMPRDCFHDLAHLNYEVGAPAFTKEIDKWLNT